MLVIEQNQNPVLVVVPYKTYSVVKTMLNRNEDKCFFFVSITTCQILHTQRKFDLLNPNELYLYEC